MIGGAARVEMPYSSWRRAVAAAGPPASLALAALPPPGRGGELRLPAGARRRLRQITARERAAAGGAATGEAAGKATG